VLEVPHGWVRCKDPNPPEGETQILEVFDLDHPTFLAIDLELQLLSQVTTRFGHHSSPCPSTFDQDYQVIHVADKAMPSRFKLFVEVIQ
jgi:hypothetical protein